MKVQDTGLRRYDDGHWILRLNRRMTEKCGDFCFGFIA